jgi:membrane fusion protein, multidrug efflux system
MTGPLAMLSGACSLAIALLGFLAQTAEPVAAGEVLRTVKLQRLEESRSVMERQFFGQVVARQTLDLAFQVGGQITELTGVEGSRIAKGDLIARLDQEPFEINLRQARLGLEQAERFLQRQQALGAATVSEVAIEEAKTAASLARLRLRKAERDLRLATLEAPFDALVAQRSVATYATVEAGTLVVRLHDMSELRAEIEVPEVLFRRANAGVSLETFAILPDTGARFPVEIREYQTEASAIGQTYTVTFALPPLDDPAIIPGASITVLSREVMDGGRILLPPSAIVIDADRRTHVMVFDEDDGQTGRVRKVPVRIEADGNGGLFMLSGPGSGREIVVAGANRVADGERVRRFTRIGN